MSEEQKLLDPKTQAQELLSTLRAKVLTIQSECYRLDRERRKFSTEAANLARLFEQKERLLLKAESELVKAKNELDSLNKIPLPPPFPEPANRLEKVNGVPPSEGDGKEEKK